MSIYDELRKYVGLKSGPIRLFSIDEKEISNAEKRLGFKFPSSLRTFYQQVGYGWLSSDDCQELRNLIIHPLDVVDLFFNESEFQPPEPFLDEDLPIFDCGQDLFLVMRPRSKNPDYIYRSDGESLILAQNMQDLAAKLSVKANFYFDV
ncbi:SMI1/KNR4 family protein [Vibrio cholerae]|uniref:SMI1/KNR4 family protein n=1 Tax=Vibrio cholerae TaxID=666 RepID=UPI002271F6F0|nr:SMI1/KNR4 family protein [Vibrio cholerae]MCX9442794.1 SMI1/KNR4 family protein [Vibrio cholerae]MCX9446328.1 SMI1/KNR4 family protein [Vibrio cholerae]